VISSDAVRKNQLPPKLIMPFHTSPIAPPGTSMLQNRFHRDSPMSRLASSSSPDWVTRE
jgi:hypothetical protein